VLYKIFKEAVGQAEHRMKNTVLLDKALTDFNTVGLVIFIK